MNIEPIELSFDRWDEIVPYLKTLPSRPTGFGLYRTDLDLDEVRAEEHVISKYVASVISYLGAAQKLHSIWAMEHRPGGGRVLSHRHNNWDTILSYPESHSCPLDVEDEKGEQRSYPPTRGGSYLLRAGCMHGIAANNTDTSRWSVVCLVDVK